MKSSHARGYSLLEAMIVILIIGILIGILLKIYRPYLGRAQVVRQVGGALVMFRQHIDEFRTVVGRFPQTKKELRTDIYSELTPTDTEMKIALGEEGALVSYPVSMGYFSADLAHEIKWISCYPAHSGQQANGLLNWRCGKTSPREAAFVRANDLSDIDASFLPQIWQP